MASRWIAMWEILEVLRRVRRGEGQRGIQRGDWPLLVDDPTLGGLRYGAGLDVGRASARRGA
jgi:hypothetical protein